MFNPNFPDFSEKTGFKRKRPRTKAVYAAMNNIMKTALLNKEMRVVCGLSADVTAAITPAIGTAMSQPFSNMASMYLLSPEGAFR